MRKRRIITGIVFVLLIVTMLTAMVACKNKTTPDIIKDYGNLAEDGSFDKKSGTQGESIVFDFKKPTTINTIVLKEKESNITSFRLYADDSTTEFYGNDFIDTYRYCSFETITLTKLRIEVLSCRDEWTISAIEAYNINNEAKDFRVMAYITVDSIYYMTEEQTVNMSKVTQFNVFSSLHLDKDGNVRFYDIDANGNTNDGEKDFEYAIDFVRKHNPNAKIVATILGNKDLDGDGLSTQERHNMAMGDNSQKFISNILAVMDKYGLDGISFDYEYPHSLKEYRIYEDFLKDLKSQMPESKILTAAVSTWQLRLTQFTAKDLEPLDQIEVMAYDMFDENGNHSTFYSTFDTIEKFRKKDIPLSKINIGVPFYSRPVNGDTFWGNYGDVAEELSPWENTYTQEYTNLEGVKSPATANYYNGRQMIYDKTRYAIDSGVGGIMIWHYACDSTVDELSLLSQIHKAINR